MDTVLGALRTEEMAERVVGVLLEAGFEANQISMLGCAAAAEASTPPTDASAADASLLTTGAVVGQMGGGFGVLALGLEETVLAVPEVGPVRVVGSLAAELSAAVSSGKPGGLAGFFVDHGVPESTAAAYADRVRGGGYVVAVHTEGDEAGERAAAIVAAQAPTRWCGSGKTDQTETDEATIVLAWTPTPRRAG